MDLMSLLQGHLTEDVVNQLSQQTGAAPEQTATAAQGIFSTLISGLAKNASTQNGASGILSALDRDHDGSILNDVMGLISGGTQDRGMASVGAAMAQPTGAQAACEDWVGVLGRTIRGTIHL